MQYDEFKEIIINCNVPVVLIEGKCNIPEIYYQKAIKMGEKIATDFPNLIFRTRTADGRDEAFSLGVKKIDPK